MMLVRIISHSSISLDSIIFYIVAVKYNKKKGRNLIPACILKSELGINLKPKTKCS
jgi:hypothetical protein